MSSIVKQAARLLKNLRNRKRYRRFLPVIIILVVGFAAGTLPGTIRKGIKLPQITFPRSSPQTVSAKELAGILQNKNFTLINVHIPYEGEIEKTDSFIPYNEIVANSASLPTDKNAPIILYCKSGRMSAEALETLGKIGYTNVRHLAGGMDAWIASRKDIIDLSGLEQSVLPDEGVTLPVSWRDLGPRLVDLGVIDLAKFRDAVRPLPDQEAILLQSTDKKIRIDRTNGQFVVDVLWALGLAQKSIVYEEGPMGKEYKATVGNFASTGGWSLARGDAITYLNRYDLIPLSPDQQRAVADIAKNVYRPCCGNPTWFPDCNHGMAALAAIELMVSAGIPEADIYRNVLALNSFWFPDNYLTIATHFARQGIPWSDVDAKLVLGPDYSSAQGWGKIAQKVGQLPFGKSRSGACGA